MYDLVLITADTAQTLSERLLYAKYLTQRTFISIISPHNYVHKSVEGYIVVNQPSSVGSLGFSRITQMC